MTGADLPVLVIGATRDDLARTVLAVAAMHEPGPHGRCPHCQPRRWRRPTGPCPTHRLVTAELTTLGPPSWRSA